MPSHAPPLRVGGKDPKVLAADAVTQLASGGGGGSGVDGSAQLSVREVKEKREGERERGEGGRGGRPRLGSMLTFFLVTSSERPFDKVGGNLSRAASLSEQGIAEKHTYMRKQSFSVYRRGLFVTIPALGK